MRQTDSISGGETETSAASDPHAPSGRTAARLRSAAGAAVAGGLMAWAAPAAAMSDTDCWSCNVMLYGVSMVQQVTTTAPQALASAMWPLMVTAVGVSIVWGIGKALTAGVDPVQPAIQAAIRIGVLSALLAGPTDIGQLTSDYLVTPALDGGAALGSALAASTADALGVSAPAQTCTGQTPGGAGITDSSYVDAANDLLTIICQVQTVTSSTYDIGAIIASQQLRSGTANDLRMALFYNVTGLLLMYMSFSMLLDFSLTLLETILRLGVFMTFVPFIAFFWVYPSLRGSVYRAFTNLLFVFVYLTLSGISSTVSVMLLLLGMRLGMNTGAGPMQTPAAIIQAFQTMVTTGSTINDSATLGAAIRFVSYTTICTSVAMGIQKGVHRLAAEVTQFQGGPNGRSMAIAATASLNSLAMTAFAGGAGMTAGLGRMAGQFVGRRAAKNAN